MGRLKSSSAIDLPLTRRDALISAAALDLADEARALHDDIHKGQLVLDVLDKGYEPDIIEVRSPCRGSS
ncbi:hypothetical protein AJ87_11895 [Rhizobium yanglingense]|nr:hypothetical protein AJ87_11895 [Rhizobium yanglingense]